MKQTPALLRSAKALKVSVVKSSASASQAWSNAQLRRRHHRRTPCYRLWSRCTGIALVTLFLLSLCWVLERRNDHLDESQSRSSLQISFATSVYWERPIGWDVKIFCPTPNGGLNVTYSSQRSRTERTDALMYYGPDLADLILKRKLHAGSLNSYGRGSRVVHVYYSEEPPFASLISDSEALELTPLMNSFDIFAGFHPGQLLSPHGRICYHGWGLTHWKHESAELVDSSPWSAYWHDPVPFEQRNSNYHAVWVQHAC